MAYARAARGQWRQIDDSVKKALEKHPRLTFYTICLPIDREDPRIDEEKWFMDKWKDNVKKWKEWAQKRGMSVEFSYWGEHEIWERLSRDIWICCNRYYAMSYYHMFIKSTVGVIPCTAFLSKNFFSFLCLIDGLVKFIPHERIFDEQKS